jgi:YebC/PmpR family DNA-binding regulatory protein
MSGHSKWSTIKNKKGKLDAQRGKMFTKLARDIVVAARQGGGDPDINFRLRLAIQNAKAINMPTDNINRAIQRAIGGAEGDNMEEIVYEGYGPGGSAVMVEILTDNRNRTAGDIRHIFAKNGGNLGENGCVGWMFERKGIIEIEELKGLDEDAVTLIALDAGAEDLFFEGEYAELITAPDELEKVIEGLKSAQVDYASANIRMIPENEVKLEGDNLIKMNKLIDMLEDHDDVQEVYTNLEDDEDA